MMLHWLESLGGAYRALAEKVGHEPDRVVNMIVEASALVAAADRTVSREEVAETLKATRQIANLHGLGLRRAAQHFEETRDRLARDTGARDALLTRLGAAHLDEAESRLILHIAGAVAAVDGAVNDDERQVLHSLARVLGREGDAVRLTGT